MESCLKAFASILVAGLVSFSTGCQSGRWPRYRAFKPSLASSGSPLPATQTITNEALANNSSQPINGMNVAPATNNMSTVAERDVFEEFKNGADDSASSVDGQRSSYRSRSGGSSSCGGKSCCGG